METAAGEGELVIVAHGGEEEEEEGGMKIKDLAEERGSERDSGSGVGNVIHASMHKKKDECSRWMADLASAVGVSLAMYLGRYRVPANRGMG